MRDAALRTSLQGSSERELAPLGPMAVVRITVTGSAGVDRVSTGHGGVSAAGERHLPGSGVLDGFQAILANRGDTHSRAGGFTFDYDHHRVIINLGLTKGGKRRGKEEQVTTTDESVILLLSLALEGRMPGFRLISKGELHFRTSFKRQLQMLNLDPNHFKPYSLRRGGATSHFEETASFDLTMKIGRWQNSRTARQYLDSAQRWLHEKVLTEEQTILIAQCRAEFMDFLK